MTDRYLGLDLSLSPGFAVIDVKNRRPTLITAQSVATDAKSPDSQRFAYIEAKTVQIAHEYRPFTAIVREDFTAGRNKRANQGIFGAWAAVDAGLGRYGLTVTDVGKPALSPTNVKKLVAGKGTAEKTEVAEAVRRILRLPSDYKFAKGYDDSDACAVALAYLIRENLIDV